MLAIRGGAGTLTLREIIETFVKFREVITRRSKFRLLSA
jgi:DNA gyrase/topoisomerase IV subunit A